MIQEVAQRFGLGDKAGSLVRSLVGMMTDESRGGLTGFLSAFDEGGMGSAVRSWVAKGTGEEIDASQVDSALDDGVVADLARKFGFDRGIIGAALAFLIPRVVDLFTPEGTVPSSASLMSRLGGFLGGAGAAVTGAGSAVQGVAGAAQRMTGEAFDDVERARRKSGGMFKWLLPLLILALVAWWFAKRCQPRSVDGGIGGDETTESMDGRDISATDGDLMHEVDAGVEGVADGAKVAGEATMEGVDAAGRAVAGGAEAVGDAAVDVAAEGAQAVRDTAAEGARVAGDAATTRAEGAAEMAGTAGEAEFDAATAVEQANEASGAALAALGDDFGAQKLVDALNLSIINFASGSAVVPGANRPLIEEAALAMRRLAAETRIEIGGHTDSSGSAPANATLSADRAGAVKEALVGLGVPAEMLSIRGHGSAQPVADNDTAQGRFRNRRISYTLVD